MFLLDLREPVSAVTHGLGAIAAVPGTWWLWRRAAGDPARRAALLVYGLSLAACFGASAVYHAACLPPGGVAALRRIDHIGIHLLIAGTYTPIAWGLLRGRLRAATLAGAWLVAGAGSGVLLLRGVPPAWVFTTIYLGAGWGSIFAYRAIVRAHTRPVARPILHGGIAYSVGAVLNLAGWPVLRPDVFGAHELFHLFVLTGAALHYGFILARVAPRRASAATPPGPERGPGRASEPGSGWGWSRRDRPHAGRPRPLSGGRGARRASG